MDPFSVIWALLAAWLLTLEVAGRLGLFGLAPFGHTLARVRNKPVGRAVLVVFWMWAGWHLFAR